MTKTQLRLQLLQQLKQQKEDDRRRRSQAIWRKVSRLAAFRKARMVCCYAALPYEVQTWQMMEAMLAQGKRVVVPVVDQHARRLQVCEVHDPARELVPGAFGVFEPAPDARQPVPLDEVDLVLVPGLAFDHTGHRLGHGHGYYDRFLAQLPATVPTVGLAYHWQLVDTLPTASHDHAVQTVLTA